MKIMIASDIHGSVECCAKLLKCFESENPQKLILLGDILYHGPRNALPDGYAPPKVCELLNPYKDRILCVRGNCDSEVDQMVLDFPVLADYALLFINDKTVFATHGHIYNEDNLPPLSQGDILLQGHTHIPVFEKRDGYTIINPGSVSIPKEGSPCSYIIVQDSTVSHVDLNTGKVYIQNAL